VQQSWDIQKKGLGKEGLDALGYVVAVANGGRCLAGWTLKTEDVLKGPNPNPNLNPNWTLKTDDVSKGHLSSTIFEESEA